MCLVVDVQLTQSPKSKNRWNRLVSDLRTTSEPEEDTTGSPYIAAKTRFGSGRSSCKNRQHSSGFRDIERCTRPSLSPLLTLIASCGHMILTSSLAVCGNLFSLFQRLISSLLLSGYLR